MEKCKGVDSMDFISRNDYIVKNAFSKYMYVGILSTAIGNSAGIIDNIFAGNYIGELALSCMGVVAPVTVFCFLLAKMFFIGGTTVMAQAKGAGDKEAPNNIFTTAIFVDFIVCVVVSAIGFYFSNDIVYALGARGEVIPLADAYFTALILSLFPNNMYLFLSAAVRLDGSIKLPLYMVIALFLSNVVLDWVSVVYLDAGMMGIGLATVISYVIGALVGCLHFFSSRNTFRFAYPKKVIANLTAMAKCSFPMLITDFSAVMRIVLLNILIVTYGTVQGLSAMNIWAQLYQALGSIGFGLVITTCILAGVFYGEKDRKALEDTLKVAVKKTIKISTIVGVLTFIFAGQLASFLGVNSSEGYDIAVFSIRSFAVTLPFLCLTLVISSFYQTLKKLKISLSLSVQHTFIYSMIFSVILLPVMNTEGIFVGLLLSEVITLLTFYLYFAWKYKRFKLSLADFVLLESSHVDGNTIRTEFSIANSMNNVMETIEKINNHIRELGLSEKNANYLSLCIEEIAGNIVQHALKSEQDKWLDVVLVAGKEQVTVTFKDNGEMFNPVMYMEENSKNMPSNEYNALGLKIIKGIASHMEYANNMGLNILHIIIKR